MCLVNNNYNLKVIARSPFLHHKIAIELHTRLRMCIQALLVPVHNPLSLLQPFYSFHVPLLVMDAMLGFGFLYKETDTYTTGESLCRRGRGVAEFVLIIKDKDTAHC